MKLWSKNLCTCTPKPSNQNIVYLDSDWLGEGGNRDNVLFCYNSYAVY